jgi:hypothetical protein
MRKWVRTILASGGLALGAASADGAILDGTNTCDVKLKSDGGADVRLIGEFQSAMGGASGIPGAPAPAPGAGRPARPPIPISTKTGIGVRDRIPPALDANIRSRDSDSGQELRDAALARVGDLMKQFGAPTFKEHKKTNRFYYLPPQQSIRVAKDVDGTPKFLLVNYTTEERADAGGIQGGLLHLLMEWSLTPAQESELREVVKKSCRIDGMEGVLVGAAELDEAGEKGSFRIISGILSDDGLRRSLVQSGHAPTMPGGQVAVAANLSKNGAQLFRSTLEKSRSIADLSVELNYGYVVQLPAAKGEIVFHWDRLQEEQLTRQQRIEEGTRTEVDAKAKCGSMPWDQFFCNAVNRGNTYYYDQSDVESLFETMIERNIVQMNFEEYQADPEATAAIKAAMMQFFTENVLKPADETLESDQDEEDSSAAGEGEEEEEANPFAAIGFGKATARRRVYNIDFDRLESRYAVKKQIVRLEAGIAVRRPLNLVGNLADFYDAVKNNPKCIQSVNLNDPFFEHREVRFILDLDAKDVFEDMANYVTVNVRKRRSTGNDFERSLTIDQKHLKDRGIQASLTYARETDQNSDVYEYQTQWSMRGGHLVPANPRFVKGNWEGVTLAVPIERWRVEVEGDLDQMAASGIARMQVEIHYPLFGQEEARVLSLSPRGGQWLVGENIYVDRGTKGFAYRLILHHKTDGRLVLPWQKRIGDRYVYATIPDEYLVVGAVREAAKQAALELTELGKEKVLDTMRDLFSDAD